MAKTSGGVRGNNGGLKEGDSNYTGKITNPQPLSAITNRELYRDITSAISRYHTALGVRQKDVKLAGLDTGVGGVHTTSNGESKNIFLNSKVFKKGTSKTVAVWAKRAYNSGHLTKTNKPVAHIVIHELSHATWNNHLTGAKHVAAGKEISRLHNTWKKDNKKKGYGSYSRTNINEFWAEASTKAVIGKNDKYSRRIKDIVKRYKL